MGGNEERQLYGNGAVGAKTTLYLRRCSRRHLRAIIVEGQRGERPEAIELVLVDGRRVRVPEGFAAEDLERVLAVLEGRA